MGRHLKVVRTYELKMCYASLSKIASIRVYKSHREHAGNTSAEITENTKRSKKTYRDHKKHTEIAEHILIARARSIARKSLLRSSPLPPYDAEFSRQTEQLQTHFYCFFNCTKAMRLRCVRIFRSVSGEVGVRVNVRVEVTKRSSTHVIIYQIL